MGDLDEVPEDPVVADLEARDAALLGKLRLVARHPRGGIALQAAAFVHLGVGAVLEEAALAQVGGRLLDAGRADACGQRAHARCRFLERAACPGEGGCVAECRADARGERHGLPERHQVARRGAAHRHAARDAGHVLHAVARASQFLAHALVCHERGHGVLARMDGGAVAERCAGPLAEEAAAHRRARALQHREQGAFGAARAERSLHFQAAERGSIEHQVRGAAGAARRTQVGERANRAAGGGGVSAEPALRVEQVAQEGAGSGGGGGVVGEVEALERAHAEVLLQERDRVGRTEHPAGGLERRAVEGARGAGCRAVGVLVVAFREEQFAWADAGEDVLQEGGIAFLHRELAGREFHRGDGGAGAGAGPGDPRGGDPVGAGVVEQGLVHQRARRKDTGHAALHHALGLGGVLELLADGHAEALFHQPAQVALDRVEGHPGHGLAPGAFGERDAERPVRGDRVLVEELVEVAHPEEEEAARVLPLETVVLAHRRGIPVVGAGGGLGGVFASGHQGRDGTAGGQGIGPKTTQPAGAGCGSGRSPSMEWKRIELSTSSMRPRRSSN